MLEIEACTGLEPTSHLLPHWATWAFSKSPALDLLMSGHRNLGHKRKKAQGGPIICIFWWPHHCLFAGPCINSHCCDEIIWTFRMLSFDSLFTKGLFIASRGLRLERERDQCLKVLSALPEDLGLGVSTQISQLVPQGTQHPLLACRYLCTCTNPHTQMHKHTHN